MKTRAERIAIILIVTTFLTFNGIMAKKAIEHERLKKTIIAR